MRDEFIRFRNYKNRVALYGFASGVLAFIGTMVDKGRWLGNFIKSVVLGYCMCTLCTVTVENSIVLPLRTKIAVQKGLGTTCLFWLLVRGIPVLITNNDIFRAVLPIENVCVPSFGHIKWTLKNFVHGQTLFNLQVGYLFTWLYLKFAGFPNHIISLYQPCWYIESIWGRDWVRITIVYSLTSIRAMTILRVCRNILSSSSICRCRRRCRCRYCGKHHFLYILGE